MAGRQRWRHVAMVGLLGGLSVALQFSTSALGSIDGYFHARYAAMLWQGGVSEFPPAFPWLPLTIRSADRYYDHHMLFHVLLAPFAAVEVIQGTKWASALFGALAFAAVYVVLVRRGIARAGWWLAAMFAVAPDFLFRMQMPRVQALSLVVLLAALELVLARRLVWLLPLAVVYTWLYDAFPLLLAIAAALAAAVAVIERRVEWRALAYPALGIAVGLIVNPYFPNDIWFVAHHYWGKAEIGEAMNVGSEWYPYPVAQWLGWAGAAAVLMAVAVLVWRTRRELELKWLTLILVGALFFFLVWRSRRFIEYAAPFVLIAVAAALDPWLTQRLAHLRGNWRRLLALLIVVGCGASSALAVVRLRQRPAPERYAGGAAWLAAYTEAGAIVFTPDWDDFPLLFFHNQRNRYVLGLDPAYLAQQDPALYRLWQQIGRGEVAQPSRWLERFQSEVIVSDHSHQRLRAELDADTGMERAYEDDDCVIFRRRRDGSPAR
ncbi:MAG: hypothetical protein HY699_17025 [Deltaproteobacteria bacterium]|nr:hypothetical protein [Deltaproteobacteria bacterium]